jgi:HEAT repeat protein
VLPLVHDEDAEVRAAAVALFMRAKDRIVAALLKRQLSTDGPIEEQRTRIRALAAIGGPESSAALRSVFESSKASELRAAAALALGQLQDPEAKTLLEREAGRLLADRRVKEACKEALKRLSQPPGARKNSVAPAEEDEPDA